MRSSRVDLQPERQLVTNLITSTNILKAVRILYRPEYMQAVYSRLVADWCVEYYDRYQQAPGKAIQDLYRTKKLEYLQKEDAGNLADFLANLNRDYEESQTQNEKFAIDEAVRYLKQRSLEILIEKIPEHIIRGDLATAESLVASFKRVEKPIGQGVSLLMDTASVKDAFSSDDEFLFRLPGALGTIAGPLVRGDFLSFLAPMKRGKTWWLWQVAETAMQVGLNAVFFTLEMTEKSMVRRGWRSLLGRPLAASTVKWPIFLPVENDGKKKFRIGEASQKFDALPVTEESDIEEQQKMLRRVFRGGEIKVIGLPAYSASVDTLSSHLDNLYHYENFVPDVVVVDYADILVPVGRGGAGEYRHQLDDIWKRLRKLAQERSVLVATASQAAKETFTKDADETNVAEDIRKLAHVTCMLALNQTKEEREKSIMRVKQLAIRDGVPIFDQALVTQCLDIGRAYLDSRLLSQVVMDDDDSEEYRPKRTSTGTRATRRPR